MTEDTGFKCQGFVNIRHQRWVVRQKPGGRNGAKSCSRYCDNDRIQKQPVAQSLQGRPSAPAQVWPTCTQLPCHTRVPVQGGATWPNPEARSGTCQGSLGVLNAACDSGEDSL